jgi:hypothetical protein
MFWGAVGYQGLSPLVRCDEKITSRLYTTLLSTHFLPHAARIGGQAYVFQQDNASAHRAQSTRNFFATRNINVLPWPPYSPDMNPIENLWGTMANEVYSEGRVYQTTETLERACRLAWANITVPEVQNLIDSMPRRLEELVNNRGGHTHY